MYEAEAKERKRLNGIANAANLNNQDDSGEVQIIEPPEEKSKSIQKAAAAFGVNRQYIADVKRIQKEAPEVFKNPEYKKGGQYNGSPLCIGALTAPRNDKRHQPYAVPYLPIVATLAVIPANRLLLSVIRSS